MWQHMFSVPVMCTVWRREGVQLMPPHSKHYRHTKHMLPRKHDGLILIIFNINNIDKEVNKEILEDDFIEDRNMLECFLKFFK